MTTQEINISELTSRLTYLKKLNIKGVSAYVSISKRPKLKTLPIGSDAYVANLFVDGGYCCKIGTLPNLVDASVFVDGIMKMKKWA
jgi:hypothetical protein